jgi:hypothetical protein
MDTGLRNLPFHGFTQSQIRLEIIALAADLLASTQPWHASAGDAGRPPPNQ